MRWLAMVAFCLPAFGQSGTAAETNMQCVERLEMPTYPWFARVMFIQGNVASTVTIGANGSVQDLKSPGAHPILTPAVEKALRASKFRINCAGKAVTLVYSFVIDKTLKSDRAGQSVSFAFPNEFSITVAPPPAMIN